MRLICDGAAKSEFQSAPFVLKGGRAGKAWAFAKKKVSIRALRVEGRKGFSGLF